MELMVMRHASTENNAKGKFRGHLPLPLSQKGISEAHEASLFIRKLPREQRPRWVISSDLPSAKQTAALMAKDLGLKLMRPTSQLRGMDIGSFAGKAKKQAEAELQECFRHREERVGGGEKPVDFDARCKGIFEMLDKVAEQGGEIPLIVAHGSNSVYLHKKFNGGGENYQEPPVEPGGLSILDGDEFTPIWKVADDSKPIPFYPLDHKAGMVVPKGGSNCEKCEYLGTDRATCTNVYFIAWNRSNVIPAPIDSYCSDWFDFKDGA